jgi:lipopolysaccharide transport system ATP-binding protein
MSESAIHVSHLTKTYEIGAKESYRALRDVLTDFVKAPFRRRAKNPTMNALDDVTLEIERGAVYGLIGKNGAGKSTLLKVLSRITEPTEGFVELRGRVGSLLEVGTGFHPELTGRENVFLNGAILGMRQVEIKRRFDEIVAFSEVNEFIDTPVKHYSSGMFMRLAFAVAAHLDSDILLVDEVLAVGDAEFQRKCLGKMGDLPNSGRTVVFVSHTMSAVSGLCQHVVWIDKGKVKQIGSPDDVIKSYLGALTNGDVAFAPGKDILVKRVAIMDKRGELAQTFAPGDEMRIDVEYDALKRHDNVYFRLIISGQQGYLFAADMLLDGSYPYIEGPGRVSVRFPALPLLPNTYSILMSIVDRSGRQNLFVLQEVASFHIAGNVKEFGLHGEIANMPKMRIAPMVLPYVWTLPDGDVREVPTKK